MEVTEVRIFPVDEDKLRAFVTIVLDHCLVIEEFKIIYNRNRFFVACPSIKRDDGSYRDVAHPLNVETRKMIEEAILGEYRNFIDEGPEYA